MAEENIPVKEKVTTLLDAQLNAIDPMTFMSSEDDATSGASIGGLCSNQGSRLAVYAIQSYIDKSTGTRTLANPLFGTVNSDNIATDYVTHTKLDLDDDQEGRVHYSNYDETLFVETSTPGYTHRMGRDVTARCVNCSGGALSVGDVVELRGDSGTSPFPCVIKADAKKYEENWVLGVIAVGGADLSQVEVVFIGVITGFNTSAWAIETALYLGDTPGTLVDERPGFPNENRFIGTVLESDAVNGIIGINIQRENFTYLLEGTILERQSVEILSDGINITYEVGNLGEPTVNLPVQIGNKVYRLDTTTGGGTGGKAVCTLSAGTTGSPQVNYVVVRLVGGVPTLTAETARPTGVFAYVGSCTVQSATDVQSHGALKHRRHTDAVYHDGRGRISYIDERLRALGAQWDTGMGASIQINTAPTPDTITGSIASGAAYQLHYQSSPALDIAVDGVLVANASGSGTLTQYQRVYDLGLLLETVSGSSLAGLRFNITLFQVVNSTSGECKLYANLPTAGYAADSNAYYDVDQTAVVSVPEELRDCAVLLCRIPVRHKTTGGGTFTFVGSDIGGLPDVIDLRGNPVGMSSSGASGVSTSFQDDQFEITNVVDPTKIATFDSSGITTATSRTFTFPDVDDILVTRNTIIPPTSSVGLPSGAIWNNGGTLAIVP